MWKRIKNYCKSHKWLLFSQVLGMFFLSLYIFGGRDIENLLWTILWMISIAEERIMIYLRSACEEGYDKD